MRGSIGEGECRRGWGHEGALQHGQWGAVGGGGRRLPGRTHDNEGKAWAWWMAAPPQGRQRLNRGD